MAFSKEILPESVCPVCGYLMDAATSPYEPNLRPKPRDLSCCLKCGEVLVFQKDLSVAVASVSDLMKLDPETASQLDRLQKAIREMRPLKFL
jgi:hypothetical protein